MFAGIEEKRIFGNKSVKVCIFPGATTHDMYGYLKPLLEKNPDYIILHPGTNNLVNETSRNILNKTLSLKNFIEQFCPTCKVIESNLIYRPDNGKLSLTINNDNDHLDAIVDDRNVGGNCLNNSG